MHFPMENPYCGCRLTAAVLQDYEGLVEEEFNPEYCAEEGKVLAAGETLVLLRHPLFVRVQAPEIVM